MILHNTVLDTAPEVRAYSNVSMAKKKSKKRALSKVEGVKVKSKKAARPGKSAKRSRKQVKKEVVSKVESKKYRPSYPGRVKLLIIEMGTVNKRGEPAWGRVATLLGVNIKTIERWRKCSGPHYHEEFADACDEAIEAVDAAKIKRSMIERAQGYTQTKKVTEMRETPDGDITVNRTEKTTLAGDPAAAKIVLPNIGPLEKRWMVKEGRVHDATGELAKLFKEIGEEPTVLPREELGIMDDERQRIQKENEEPAVAAQQSILDS